jgi:hypothetical protein
MGFLRRRSLPAAWLLLLVGLCILAAAAVDVSYVAIARGGAPSAAAVEARYPLPGINGVLDLQHQPFMSRLAVGGPCKGLGRYGDLLGGTPVVVKDQTGSVIATGALDIGQVVAGATCRFALVVPALPKAELYEFDVAQRVVRTYSYNELTARNWQVTLALG